MTERSPSQKARVIATTGAVIIYTEEGNVVITPNLARSISAHLSRFADMADAVRKNNLFLASERKEITQ